MIFLAQPAQLGALYLWVSMSGVLLPIRLCSPTVQELKHRRVVGQALEVDSDSDTSESSDDSAANEYAEGLGFADRRREAVSNFEFDHHPREEYFEEPWLCHALPLLLVNFSQFLSFHHFSPFFGGVICYFSASLGNPLRRCL